MLSPFQFSVPESAQVHIHIGAPTQLVGPGGTADPHPAPQSPDIPKRHTLRLAVGSLLVFGLGYMAHGVTTIGANAQGPLASSLGLPLPPAYPDAPAGAVLGSTPGLPSSIHVNPLPAQPTILSGRAPAQHSGQTFGAMPAPYAVQAQRPLSGMAVRAPFPAIPDASQPTGQASPPALGTPTLPRNPFGLE